MPTPLFIAAVLTILTPFAVFAIPLTGVAGPTARTECIDYNKYMHLATFLSPPSIAFGLALSGHYAVLTNAGYQGGVSGVDIVDVSDPLAPRHVGHADLPTWGVCVAVSGDYAYATMEGYEGASPGFQVVDIADPHHPRPQGMLDLPPGVRAVVASGSHAFVANGSYGLSIIDISDPEQPRLESTFPTHGKANGVAVTGRVGGAAASYAYVANGDAGLLVVELGTPVAPHKVGHMLLDQEYDLAEDIIVSGTTAYLTGLYGGLYTLDLSEPAHPRVIGHVQTPGTAYGFTVSGARAFLASASKGLQVVDVADPTLPVIAGSVERGYLRGCVVLGGFAFAAAEYNGLEVIDVSGAESTKPVGSVGSPGMAQGLAVRGDHAYLGCGSAGLQVIDVANPEQPAIVGSLDTPGWAIRPAMLGNYACLPDRGSVVHVIDIADAASPRRVSTLSTYRGAAAAAADDRYVYVTEDSYFEVFDLADPHHPHRTGYIPFLPSGPIALGGHYAYVGAWNDLRIINIADPAYPAQVGQIPMSGTTDLAISGSALFMAVSYPPRLCIVDVSVPSAPVIVSELETLESTTGIAVAGDVAYLTTYGGVSVIDVEDLSHPFVLGEGHTPDIADGVMVADGNVYLSVFGTGYFSGLVVYPAQCADPRSLDWADGAAGRTAPFHLRAAPNPMHGGTGLSFTLSARGRVQLAIHNAAGQLVRMLHDGPLPAGPGRIEWDGRDSRGHLVAAGMYWARISSPDGEGIAKIVLLK